MRMRITVRTAVLVLVGLLAPVVLLQAHPAPFSFLELRLQPDAIAASIVLHDVDVAHELGVDPPSAVLVPAAAAAVAPRVGALISDRLRLVVNGRPVPVPWELAEILRDRESIRLQAAIPVDRPVASLAVEGVAFPYDPIHQTFVTVHDEDVVAQAILDRSHQRYEHFAGNPDGIRAIVGRFLAAGVHHILIGPDHVLFLIGLLLPGGSIRRLAIIVTGFTLAHSLTLSLAVLDAVAPPAWMIEPAIALSIVYIGLDNLLVRGGGRDVRHWIAFGFGLLHGFGFASVLASMDLPRRALGWSLVSFNVGVEVGQLAIVVVVATVLAALRRRSEALVRRIVLAGSLGVILAGAYWFIERTMFPGGF